MKIVFNAANGFQAHLIKDLLQTQQIEAVIHGEYLQGGIGELPMFGLVNVLVEERHFDVAKEVIDLWESGQLAAD